jgi:hypothetical protein
MEMMTKQKQVNPNITWNISKDNFEKEMTKL